MSSARRGVRPIPRKFGWGSVAALSVIATAAAGVVTIATPAAYAAGATFTVNTTADDPTTPPDPIAPCLPSPGQCTLRDAINAANTAPGADTVAFAIGTGAQTITPAADLPLIADTVTIDGTTQPGYGGFPLIELNGANVANSTGLYLASNGNTVRGLIINGFSTQQILIGESSNNTITNNYLGKSTDGSTTLAGGSFGTLRIRANGNGATANNNVIGGLTTNAGNIIGGATSGVGVEAAFGGSATGNIIQGNQIDSTGLEGNSTGVRVTGTVSGTQIESNSIYSNGGLGIDLAGDGVTANDSGDVDTGPNNLQNYPNLTAVTSDGQTTTVTGTLDSTPGSSFRLEFFDNNSCDPSGFGEGQSRIGNTSVSTDEGGMAPFTATSLNATSGSAQITATATNLATGDTSEFSACQGTGISTSPPDPPTGVAAGAGDARAEVSWIVPASDGGSPIDHYTIASNPDTASTPFDVAAGSTTATVTGLTNGTPYTFTVTATNGNGQTSNPSAPSEAVTPRSGAAPPEAETAEVPAGGSLSTGTSASVSDPTNTTIATPNAGTVSIGEGAMTGTPPAGVTYFGQQIDITAPDATQSNPMTFTFVYDCSVLPAGVSTCGGATATGAAAARTAGATEAAAPTVQTAAVSVRDYGYMPRLTTLDTGGTVTWSFQGTRQHSVTDSLGLGSAGGPMFNSGSRSPGSSYSRTFVAAGRYAYRSTSAGDPSSFTGTVSVPMRASQSTGDTATPITLTWASSRPSGYRFDVQYRFKAPGSSSYGAWTRWRSNTATTSGQFTGASLMGKGDYQFHSRLENANTGRDSQWSTPLNVAITAASGGPSRLDQVAIFHETDAGNVQVPDCTGPDGVATPGPACTWSEIILSDGDLQIVVYTSRNGRWRSGRTPIA